MVVWSGGGTRQAVGRGDFVIPFDSTIEKRENSSLFELTTSPLLPLQT